MTNTPLSVYGIHRDNSMLSMIAGLGGRCKICENCGSDPGTSDHVLVGKLGGMPVTHQGRPVLEVHPLFHTNSIATWLAFCSVDGIPVTQLEQGPPPRKIKNPSSHYTNLIQKGSKDLKDNRFIFLSLSDNPRAR